jgi:hypothetical protein
MPEVSLPISNSSPIIRRAASKPTLFGNNYLSIQTTFTCHHLSFSLILL